MYSSTHFANSSSSCEDASVKLVIDVYRKFKEYYDLSLYEETGMPEILQSCITLQIKSCKANFQSYQKKKIQTFINIAIGDKWIILLFSICKMISQNCPVKNQSKVITGKKNIFFLWQGANKYIYILILKIFVSFPKFINYDLFSHSKWLLIVDTKSILVEF